MNRPVRYSRGRVRYTGRIARAAFVAWSDSSDGRSMLDPITSRMRFAPFGKARAARRRVWRELIQAARSDTVVGALQREIDAYLARLDTLAHARDLPCVGIDLRRLVAVPRLFANAAIDRRMDVWLDTHPVFATVNGRKSLRDWFILAIIDAIEASITQARSSPKQPLAAGGDWILVGVNDRFEWRIPFSGPAWPGHYYLLELTQMPMTRAVRKAAGKAIASIEASLPSLPRPRRDEILRQAGLSLEQLRA
jgi:hypothetical protein